MASSMEIFRRIIEQEQQKIKVFLERKDVFFSSPSLEKLRLCYAEAQREVDCDSDLDGLTDFKEHLLGTNPYSADMDCDGYTDLEELSLENDPRRSNKPVEHYPKLVQQNYLASSPEAQRCMLLASATGWIGG